MKDSEDQQVPHKPTTVLVVVGTDHHQFNRLVQWMDEWHLQLNGDKGRVRCVVQYGTSIAPVSASGEKFFTRNELDELLAQADAVVCHGGPSTIVEVMRRGLVPIVLPRSPLLQEHIDHHQERFAAHMSARGHIDLIATSGELHRKLAAVLAADTKTAGTGATKSSLPDPAEGAARLALAVGEVLADGRSRRLRLLLALSSRRKTPPAATAAASDPVRSGG